MNIRTFVTILSQNPQYDFPKMRGGVKAVWNFSENSSVLVTPSVPKSDAGNSTEDKIYPNSGQHCFNLFDIFSYYTLLLCSSQYKTDDRGLSVSLFQLLVILVHAEPLSNKK